MMQKRNKRENEARKWYMVYVDIFYTNITLFPLFFQALQALSQKNKEDGLILMYDK